MRVRLLATLAVLTGFAAVPAASHATQEPDCQEAPHVLCPSDLPEPLQSIAQDPRGWLQEFCRENPGLCTT